MLAFYSTVFLVSASHIQIGMASSEDNNIYLSEWEMIENGSEESEANVREGEEAAIDQPFNKVAWERSCEKLKTDAKYHKHYIPIADALSFPQLSITDQEAFVRERELSFEDKAFLTSEKGFECLANVSNSVVRITVQTAGSGIGYGTGFFVKANNSDVAVITNSHNVRHPRVEEGDFLVKPSCIKVTCFCDGKPDGQVQCEVDKIELASRPEKNREEEALLNQMKGKLDTDGSKDSEDLRKCKEALEILRPYFNRRDAFLDYAFLYLKPLDNDEFKLKFAKVKALEMKPFQILDNFRNVSSFGIPDPSSSRYPRSLRLFSISHPHGHSRVVSFGGMESSIQHVNFLNLAYGQNDTGMLSGKEPFVEHSVTTCRGCSGAPIFFNHTTGEVETDSAAVYFIHFFGIPVNESNKTLHGKAVSFATIIKHEGHRPLHSELGRALAEVKEFGGDS